MSKNRRSETSPAGSKAEREARLAEALRVNLRRRKAAVSGGVSAKAGKPER